MDPTDFKARYRACRARALGCPPDDQLHGLCASAPMRRLCSSPAPPLAEGGGEGVEGEGEGAA
jgi:hypothetical protein